MGQTSTFTEKDRWKTYKISHKEPKEVSKQMKWGAGGGSLLLRCKIQCKVEKLSKQDPQKSPTGQSPSPARRGQTTPLTAKSSVIPVYPPQFAKKPHQKSQLLGLLDRTSPIEGFRENPRVGIISLASSLTGLGRKAACGEEGGGPETLPLGVRSASSPPIPAPLTGTPQPVTPAAPLPPLLRRECGPRRPLILPPGPASRASHPAARDPAVGRGGGWRGGRAGGRRPPAPRRLPPGPLRCPGNSRLDTDTPRAFAQNWPGSGRARGAAREGGGRGSGAVA